MNWLDWIFIIIMVVSAIRGFRVGFFTGISGIAGLLGGIWAAARFHGQLADYLAARWNWDDIIAEILLSWALQIYPDFLPAAGGLPDSIISAGTQIIYPAADTILNIIAFGMIVTAVYLVAGGILRLASLTISRTIFFPFDRLGGLVLGLVKGGLLATAILVILLWLNTPLSLLLSPAGGPQILTVALEKSKIAPFMLNIIKVFNLTLPGLNMNTLI